MSYKSILNLYKNQDILMFKECYALEKIEGTSAHIGWKFKQNKINYYHGGANRDNFLDLFNHDFLLAKFQEIFPNSDVVIYGEAYGGKLMGMSKTYGTSLKFIGFEVKIDDVWLNVPNAEDVCKKFNIEFVDYVKISADMESIDAERNKPSTQAKRNGIKGDKLREGIVLRPLVELTLNNGERIVAKHKNKEFMETATYREVNPEQLLVLEKAEEIANEWVTEQRMNHILSKLPENLNISNTLMVIKAMTEDIIKESKNEIIESKEAFKVIGTKTAIMFKKRLSLNKE